VTIRQDQAATKVAESYHRSTMLTNAIRIIHWQKQQNAVNLNKQTSLEQ
jgi:hypothetical protein